MPRLPTVDTAFGTRPSPQLSGGIAPLRFETQRGDVAVANAKAEFAGNLSDTFFVLAKQEKIRVDSARLEEATNEYWDGLTDLALNPETGYSSVLGGEAVKRPLRQEYQEKANALANKISDTLTGDQRDAFTHRVKLADRQFNTRLYEHVSTQTRAYEQQIFDSSLASERKQAALNWAQPGAIGLSVLRTDYLVNQWAANEGLNPDRKEDKIIIDQRRAIENSKIHADVIDMMLASGKDLAAKTYYEGIKDRLTDTAAVTLAAKVDISSVEGESIRAVDKVWEELGPRTSDDPIPLVKMEDTLRATYRAEPKIAKAAIGELRSRIVAFNSQQQEEIASNKSAILDAFHSGASLKQLQGMTEWRALDGISRSQMRDYVVASGWTAVQRARAEEEARVSAHGQRRYWELSRPEIMAGMSEQQIVALEPEIGAPWVNQLMNLKRKPPGAASIDDDLFKTLAAEAGFSPYNTRIPTEQKEQLGRLKSRVESVIEQSGVALTREQKEKIMRSEIDRTVMLDVWGRDKKLPAASVTPEQRKSVYVPFNEIEPAFVSAAINYMRSVGLIPVDVPDSRVTAKSSTRQRIEKAYGLRAVGGSRDEIDNALRGK